jgi:hypothetical protein
MSEAIKPVCVHVNSRYVQSDVRDLDVFDRYTLECAVRSCAGQANTLLDLGLNKEALLYVAFKNRIKDHLKENN